MKNLKRSLQMALMALGLSSMCTFGANNVAKWIDRESCLNQPLAEFVEHSYWDWDCRVPLRDNTWINVDEVRQASQQKANPIR